MYKTIEHSGIRYSFSLNEFFFPREMVTGETYIPINITHTEIKNNKNHINRKLITMISEIEIFADCDEMENEGGTRVVGTILVTVFVLRYQKDNRETRRGNGKIENKVLNMIVVPKYLEVK